MHNLRNYLHTTWVRVLLEKLIGSQLVKKFPTFHGTRRFITAFTNARHLSLSWARSIQSMPSHPASWKFTLILSSHRRLDLPSGSLPQVSPPKPCICHSSPNTCYITRPSHSSDFIIRTMLGEGYRSLSCSLCSSLHYPVVLSFLGPNILLNTQFSNTLSLRSSLNVSHQFSHPHKTAGKIIVLLSPTFKFLDCKLEDKIFCSEW